jgi:Flp pilus assembly protein TadD
VIEEGFASGKLPRSNRDAASILAEASGRVSSDRAALPGLEARARADSKGALALNVADGYYGHGNYAKAVEFYRLAVQKGGVDSGLANLRLGMALAQAGQRAEAEAAFKAVSGPRAGLASYWLLWLSQRA